MKYILFLSGWLVLCSCNGTGEKMDPPADTTAALTGMHPDSLAPKTITAEMIMDSLQKISFVAESQHYIDSFSRHKHGLAFLMDTTQDQKIHIRAGYNGNEVDFETYYIFTVDSRTFDIKITEPVSGDEMTITAYQKAQKI